MLERGGEIAAHPGIIARAQRLIAHLLYSIEAGTGHRLGGHMAGVEGGVVMAQAQREAIGRPARLHRRLARDSAPRHRHAQRATRKRGGLGGPHHFQLRLMRDRPRRAG